MQQIWGDLYQSLAKPRMRYCRTCCTPSLFDPNQTFRIGIPGRSRKDELTDRWLSLKNEDADPICQPTRSEAKLRLHLVQRQTDDISFDGEVALDVFHGR